MANAAEEDFIDYDDDEQEVETKEAAKDTKKWVRSEEIKTIDKLFSRDFLYGWFALYMAEEKEKEKEMIWMKIKIVTMQNKIFCVTSASHDLMLICLLRFPAASHDIEINSTSHFHLQFSTALTLLIHNSQPTKKFFLGQPPLTTTLSLLGYSHVHLFLSLSLFNYCRGHYVGIHTSNFRDFILKPELLRAVVDCGFEHPSEG